MQIFTPDCDIFTFVFDFSVFLKKSVKTPMTMSKRSKRNTAIVIGIMTTLLVTVMMIMILRGKGGNDKGPGNNKGTSNKSVLPEMKNNKEKLPEEKAYEEIAYEEKAYEEKLHDEKAYDEKHEDSNNSDYIPKTPLSSTSSSTSFQNMTSCQSQSHSGKISDSQTITLPFAESKQLEFDNRETPVFTNRE